MAAKKKTVKKGGKERASYVMRDATYKITKSAPTYKTHRAAAKKAAAKKRASAALKKGIRKAIKVTRYPKSD